MRYLSFSSQKIFLSCMTACLSVMAMSANADERKDKVFEIIDRNAKQIADIGDAVFYFAEPGMQEFESTRLLKDTLEAAGFSVELGGANMPTNLWAKWGSGKPTILIASEIDALPEGSQTPGSIARKPLVAGAPGHMEGHNTHAGVTLGAMYALKEVMKQYKLPGTIILSLGPAEEQLASRPFLVRAGYLKDVDAGLSVHIWDNYTTGWGLLNYGALSSTFTFHGRTAHAGLNPWEGKDAVDAIELMDIGLDKMREHLHPGIGASRVITSGGIQPGIIPDLGRIAWNVRGPTGKDIKDTFDKLVKIGEGAAMMTGTTMDPPLVKGAAWPTLGNRPLAEALRKNMETVGLPKWTEEEISFAKEFQKANKQPETGLATALPAAVSRPQSRAANDLGDYTWNIPFGLMTFPSSVPGIGYHTWPAAVTPTSSMAHKGMVAGAKVLAATALDILVSPDLLRNAKERFAEDTRTTKYFPLFPDNATPQVELHKELMDGLRPAMSKHYLKLAPRFK